MYKYNMYYMSFRIPLLYSQFNVIISPFSSWCPKCVCCFTFTVNITGLQHPQKPNHRPGDACHVTRLSGTVRDLVSGIHHQLDMIQWNMDITGYIYIYIYIFIYMVYLKTRVSVSTLRNRYQIQVWIWSDIDRTSNQPVWKSCINLACQFLKA